MKAKPMPELYYSDDGGVSDSEHRFCAWCREMWREHARQMGIKRTWDEELARKLTKSSHEHLC